MCPPWANKTFTSLHRKVICGRMAFLRRGFAGLGYGKILTNSSLQNPSKSLSYSIYRCYLAFVHLGSSRGFEPKGVLREPWRLGFGNSVALAAQNQKNVTSIGNPEHSNQGSKRFWKVQRGSKRFSEVLSGSKRFKEVLRGSKGFWAVRRSSKRF